MIDEHEETEAVNDETLQAIFVTIAFLMIYGSPFVALWDLGAAVMFLVVGVGTFAGLLLGQK